MNKILKNKLLKGATLYTYCLKKEAKIGVYQANTADTSMGTDSAGRPRGCSSHAGKGAFFKCLDALQKGRKRADTNPEPLLFLPFTTTAGAIFCCQARILFSYTSLCCLLNKQLATTTRDTFREPRKWVTSVFNTVQFPNAFF